MDLITEESGGKPRFNTPSPVVDGAGNIFVGIAQVAGVGTQYRKNILILGIQPDGYTEVLDERNVPDGGLVDGVGIVQSGRQLHVFAGAHIGDPTARLYHYALDVCVPYPTGAVQVGMEGAHMPEGGEPVGGVTEEQVQAIVDGAVAEVVAQFGGSGVRDGIEQKAQDAFGKNLDPERYDSDPRARYAQDAGAPWVRNRAYEGALAALRLIGLYDGPLPGEPDWE